MKKLNTLALICLSVSSSQATVPLVCHEYRPIIDLKGIDEWGLLGESKSSIIIPDTDFSQGGNSFVLDPEGEVIGPCVKHDGTIFNGNICTENWNISATFTQVNNSTSHISSQLRVTDYVPSSKATTGWAYAGWWISPHYDTTQSGDTVFDKSSPIGFSDTTHLQFVMSYSKDEILTIQLKGEGIDENDKLQSPPRFTYIGTGQIEHINIPLSHIKRASWSEPQDYDFSKVSSIGILRLEEALSEGALFPGDSPKATQLEFAGLNERFDCPINPIYTQYKENNILNQEVEIYSLQGEKLSSQVWTGTLKNHPQGLYLIKFDGQVMKYNHP